MDKGWSLRELNDKIRRAVRNKTGATFTNSQLRLMAEAGVIHLLSAKEADELVALLSPPDDAGVSA